MNVLILEGNGPEQFELVVETPRAEDRLSARPTISVAWHGRFCRVHGLYVPVGLRRRKFATALVRHAVGLASSRWHGQKLFLDAIPFADRPLRQSDLVRFYERQGFARVPGHPYSMLRVADAEGWQVTDLPKGVPAAALETGI